MRLIQEIDQMKNDYTQRILFPDGIISELNDECANAGDSDSREINSRDSQVEKPCE
jgi:hypothetical protein